MQSQSTTPTDPKAAAPAAPAPKPPSVEDKVDAIMKALEPLVGEIKVPAPAPADTK